jgi:hypothetical protein
VLELDAQRRERTGPCIGLNGHQQRPASLPFRQSRNHPPRASDNVTA